MLIRRTEQKRPGTIVPLVAVSAIFMITLIAFAIDIGLIALARTQCQNAADSGATAGVRQLNGNAAANNNYSAVVPAVNAAVSANTVISQPIDPTTNVSTNIGWYSYNTTAQQFQTAFGSSLPANQNWSAVQVTINTTQPTYFAKIFGITSMPASAVATSVSRPRDIAIVLDFSFSMRFASLPAVPRSGALTASMNPDTAVPAFGHWSTMSSILTATSNYVDSSGNAYAMNNWTTTTVNGPPVVQDFYTYPASGSPLNAFYQPGSSTYMCPASSDWSTQSSNTVTYVGDLWPQASEGTATSNPTYAATVQQYLFGTTNNATYASNTMVKSSATGPGSGAFDPVTPSAPLATEGYGPNFNGYSMGPGYYGKTFYMWPPDPRYHPTNTALQLDWRQKFFITQPLGTGTRTGINDNSKLFNSSGVWQPSGSSTYYIDYNAVIAWIAAGPQVFPPNLRSGRVLYYSSIPTTIPATGGTSDQRFWRAYIDYVLGAASTTVTQNTLYGADTSANFGTVKITPYASLNSNTSQRPYMQYNDNPVRPRLHFWFGPLSMIDFLATNNINSTNWWPGTCHESTTWQLKAGMNSALIDIQNNHPNDWATLIYFNSLVSYGVAQVPLGRNFTLMQNFLWYPNATGTQGSSIVQNPSNTSNEYTPYGSSYYTNRIDQTTNSSDPFRVGTNPDGVIPNANNDTCSDMPLCVAYNQFSTASPYTGRVGATKMVIYETDGVANSMCNATFQPGNPAPYNSTYTNTTSVSEQANGAAPVITNAHQVAAQLCAPTTATAGQQATINGVTYTYAGPGYSTSKNPVSINCLAFGFLFESYSIPGALGGPVSTARDPAMQLIYDLEVIGGVAPPNTSSSRIINTNQIIIGNYTNRINCMQTAIQAIMESGVVVSLVQ